MLIGIAKPIPFEPPLPLTIAVLIPTTRPFESRRAPPRIARIDRCVRLDEILDRLDLEVVPPEGAHDPVGDGQADVKGVAHRKHGVAHLQLVAVAEGRGRKAGGLDLEDGDVRLLVAADHRRLEFPLGLAE